MGSRAWLFPTRNMLLDNLPLTADPKAPNPASDAGETTRRQEYLRLDVLRLINRGYSLTEAANDLGISRYRVSMLVKQEMEVVAQENCKEAMDWRMKLTMRQESRIKRLAEIMERAKDNEDLTSEINAIAKASGIDVELAKLWGAAAPVRTDITSNGEKIETAPAVFAVPVQALSIAEWQAARTVDAAPAEVVPVEPAAPAEPAEPVAPADAPVEPAP
jgi:hypothetical protein